MHGQSGTENVKKNGLVMQLVDVEYTFDNSKLIFYFTADGRVDFRELVKDLAGIYRTRIELRQIGVRDEAKLIGGIGVCRPSVLLQELSLRLRAGFHQNGQGAEPFALLVEDQRGLRTADVLPAVRA